MAKVIAYSKQRVVSGDYNNWDDSDSIFGSPGSNTISAGYFYCDIYIGMALCDDGSLWLAPNGGTISSARKIGNYRKDWDVMLYADKNSFGVTAPAGGSITVPSTATLVFSGVASSSQDDSAGETVNGTKTGPVSYTIRNAGEATVGQAPPSGYVKVSSGFSVNNETKTAWVWVSGVVDPGTRYTDTASMEGKKLQITGQDIIDKLFDYFPWGRHNGTEFISANAKVHSLKRYNGSQWTDVKNTYGSTGTNKGFRHNGTSWVKSPITGKE